MTAPQNSPRFGNPQVYRALLTAGLLAIVIGGSAAISVHIGTAATHSGTQVYRAERAAISITLGREGRYLVRVNVTALARCTNGQRTTIKFIMAGGPRIRITGGGRFNMSRFNAHESRVLKGRVEGDVIRGYFRAFYDGPPEGRFKPRCGTAVPNSRPIHFTARRAS